MAVIEDPPADFTCIICEHVASNRFLWSARDYQRPPICKSCEMLSGYAWHGGAINRTKPRGGTARDKREAMRIGALADAIAQEANRQKWSPKNVRA